MNGDCLSACGHLPAMTSQGELSASLRDSSKVLCPVELMIVGWSDCSEVVAYHLLVICALEQTQDIIYMTDLMLSSCWAAQQYVRQKHCLRRPRRLLDTSSLNKSRWRLTIRKCVAMAMCHRSTTMYQSITASTQMARKCCDKTSSTSSDPSTS